MIVKLLTEHHLEFLSLKVGCRGSPESVHVKMTHCWKSQATAQINLLFPDLFYSRCIYLMHSSRLLGGRFYALNWNVSVIYHEMGQLFYT